MTEFLKRITKNDIRNVIAIIIVLGCFILVYFMMIKPVPPENKEMLNIVAGFVFGSLGGVVGYYFGSSKAEGDKAKKEVTDETT